MSYRNTILDDYNYRTKKQQWNFEKFIEDEKKDVERTENWVIEQRCASIAPLTLFTICKLSKNSLINVILLREISYDDLVKKYNEDIKQSGIYKFFDEQGKNVLNHYQNQNSKLISIVARLEKEISELKKEKQATLGVK